MDKALENQIRNLLKLDEESFDRELVGAVSRDEDFLVSLNLPSTVPPQTASHMFASLNSPERLRRVRSGLQHAVNRNRYRLYGLVCIELDYCKKKHAGEVRMRGAILAGLMGKGIILVAYPKLWPIPIRTCLSLQERVS